MHEAHPVFPNCIDSNFPFRANDKTFLSPKFKLQSLNGFFPKTDLYKYSKG